MNIECDYLETWKQNYDLKENECNKIVEEIQRKKKKELEILYLENLNEKEKKNLGIIENERQNKILEINVDELEVG